MKSYTMVYFIQLFVVLVLFHIEDIKSYRFHRFIYNSKNCHQSTISLFNSPSSTATGLNTKVFIGNLPFTITINEITQLIEENVGEGLIKPNGIQIPVGKKSKSPRGYVFVDMIDDEAAMVTADRLNDIMFHDRQLNSNVKESEAATPSPASVKKLATKSQRISKNTVFLTNIDNSLDEREILNMCEDIIGLDVVKSLQILRDKATSKPRGVCYIEFNSNETAQKAITEFNGLEVLGRLLVCTEYKPKKIDRNNPSSTSSSSTAGDEGLSIDDIIYY